jgi:hypothetical protein
VQVPHLGIEARIVLPRRRHEQRDRLGQIPAAAADEELERVVEQRGVRPVAVECRREPRLDAEGALAGLEPGDVALDRVDLSVVTEEAERLRALPARLGVRREPLVEDRERDRERRILEIGVEVRKLPRGTQSLVGHGAEGQRGDVDAGDALRAAPCSVGAALHVRVLARRQHELVDARQRGERSHAEVRGPGRNGAPAGRLEPFGAARVLDGRAVPAFAQEAHREPGSGRPGQCGGDWLGERQENAGAVSGDAVRGPGAAVADRGEARERAVEQLARAATPRVGD